MSVLYGAIAGWIIGSAIVWFAVSWDARRAEHAARGES